VTKSTGPKRLGVQWSPEARIDLRAIDRLVAMQILDCVDRYLANRIGGVKKLKRPFTGLRLRCGDYRVFFDDKDSWIKITSVRHRKDAYR
jgi:mRNA-degrading endonuclease RelE of RelBE toxin-antitoxin system